MFKYILAGLVLAILCFTTYDAQGAVFLKIDSIPGDSTTSGHENQIEINSFQFGVSNPSTISSSGILSGKASFNDLQISKMIDNSSPQLLLHTVNGMVLPKAEIFLTKDNKGTQFTFAHYTLKHVIISSYSTASDGSTTNEDIGINFEQLQTETTPINPDGTIGNTVSFCWDNVENKECATDISIPTVTGTANMTANVNGWYNHPLVITWNGNDPVDGISSCDSPITYSGPDAKGVTETGHCTDNSGNIGTGTISINYDTTPPTITGSSTTAANANGWYNTTVAVHFTASDLLSGLASVTPDTSIATEGINQQVTGTAVDNASNSASFTVSGINIDKTPPTVSVTSSRSPDHNGWYNHPIVLSWAGTDALSGIDSCDPATNYAGPDGTSIALTGNCLDKAGNRGSTTVTIKYDTTPPSITVSANMTVFPTNPSGALVSYPPANATDDEPSTASCSPLSGSEFPFGPNIVTCNAIDDAGNSAAKTFAITVLTPIQADQKLASIVNGMNLQGGETNSLNAKLAAALSSLNSHNNNTAKNQLNALLNEVNAQTGKKISQSQATELIQDAQDIINSIQ